jgi:hypothetical protein
VEPVAGNMGCILPKGGIEGLRKLCTENGILLIFLMRGHDLGWLLVEFKNY